MSAHAVANTRRKSLRLRAFALHGWLGAALSLYLALLFATGTLIVFDREIDRFLSREIAPGTSMAILDPGWAFDRVITAIPEAEVQSIAAQGADWYITYRVGDDRMFGWLDGTDGSLSALNSKWSFQRIVRDLHSNLLTGHWLGRVAITAMGAVLLYQIGSGLWAYRRFWRGLFRLPARGQPAAVRWGAFPRIAGLWSLPVLAVAALTSLVFLADAFGFYPEEAKAPGLSERADSLPEGFDGQRLREAIAAAEASMPGFAASAVDLPGNRRAPVKVLGETAARLVQPKINVVVIDPATLAVLDMRRGEELGAAGRVYAAAFPLHYGEFGGNVTRTIWVVGGVIGTILALSGAYVHALRSTRGRGGMGTLWSAVPLIFRLGLIAAVLLAIAMYGFRYA